MSIGTILVIILILALFGVLPVWDHSRSYGWGPGGAIGVLVIIFLILVLTGRF